MARASEIAELDGAELLTRLDESRKELFNLRFQLATGQLDNHARLGQVRRDIARMLGELRAREIAEAEGLALEELPAHRAAARERAADVAVGRTRTPAAERRAAARAAEEEPVAEEVRDVEAAGEPVASDEAAGGASRDVPGDASSPDEDEEA
jgi:large subunit ribosomal protein L29